MDQRMTAPQILNRLWCESIGSFDKKNSENQPRMVVGEDLAST